MRPPRDSPHVNKDIDELTDAFVDALLEPPEVDAPAPSSTRGKQFRVNRHRAPVAVPSPRQPTTIEGEKGGGGLHV